MQVLFDKLIRQRHYYLALQASSFIRVPDNLGSSCILTHWAKFKVNVFNNVAKTHQLVL